MPGRRSGKTAWQVTRSCKREGGFLISEIRRREPDGGEMARGTKMALTWEPWRCRDAELFCGDDSEINYSLMGKVRRSGYVLEWFIGDHEPRHVHVYDAKGRQIGRLDIDRLVGVEGWMPDRKLVKLIEDLRREGRL